MSIIPQEWAWSGWKASLAHHCIKLHMSTSTTGAKHETRQAPEAVELAAQVQIHIGLLSMEDEQQAGLRPIQMSERKASSVACMQNPACTGPILNAPICRADTEDLSMQSKEQQTNECDRRR